MTKHNPLFVDSTKFHGDVICTQIELKNVLLYDGETLWVMITNHQDVSRRLQMRSLDDRTYEAKIHLNHQTSVTYRFVIEKDGERVFQSANLKARAQYAVIEEWEPFFDQEEEPGAPPAPTPLVTEEKQPETMGERAPVPPAPALPTASRVRETSMNVRSIIEKWGF
jgi:hypothetical protein